MARDNATRSKPPPDTFERYWPELRGRVQERWSLLTNDRLEDIDGRQRRLAERLREAYGVSEAEASRQVDDFVETHWGAIGAGNLTPTSVSTSDSAGALGGGNTTGTHSNNSGLARGGKSGGRKSGEADSRSG